MMTPAIGIAIPKSEADKAKMRAFGQRDYFQFRAEPVETTVKVPGRGNVPALRWEFDDLDPLIRITLVAQTMSTSGRTANEADSWLSQTGVYFVKDDLEIRMGVTEP